MAVSNITDRPNANPGTDFEDRRRHSMSGQDIAKFAGVGVAAWFAFALSIRFLGPVAFDAGPLHLILYLCVAPVGFVTTWAIARVTRTPTERMVGPMVVMLTAAMLLDGMALVVAGGLYGDPAILAPAGAAILWGAGWFFIAAIAFAGWRIGN